MMPPVPEISFICIDMSNNRSGIIDNRFVIFLAVSVHLLEQQAQVIRNETSAQVRVLDIRFCDHVFMLEPYGFPSFARCCAYQPTLYCPFTSCIGSYLSRPKKLQFFYVECRGL